MHAWFRRHVALPAEHGAWVFIGVPLLVGLFAGGRLTLTSLYLVVAALAAFLARQPLTLVIKVVTGRRGRDVLPAAIFWLTVYGSVALSHVVGLNLRGHGYVMWLALPCLPVLGWYLWLVARREERRQWLVEIVAAGALALAAPAAYWIGVDAPNPTGWLLWLLTWAQSTASIAHAYMRLEQRALGRAPGLNEGGRLGRAAIGATSFNLLLAVGLGLAGRIPPLVFVAFAVQWVETVWGAMHPAVGLKPAAIGLRQLAATSLFTVVFIAAWRL